MALSILENASSKIGYKKGKHIMYILLVMGKKRLGFLKLRCLKTSPFTFVSSNELYDPLAGGKNS